MPNLDRLLEEARELSWSVFGKRIVFYLPGMFTCDGTRGRYPALSITGGACALECEHCRARLLASMIEVSDPEALVATCRSLERAGNLGVLLSGGCDLNGRLPWEAFLPAIRAVKATMSLKISVHCGFVDEAAARGLKAAGVDQALVDVIGCDETYRMVYHVESGVSRLEASLEALRLAGLPVIPHIVCGLHYGEMRGEAHALDLVSKLDPRLVVILSLMPLPDTPMASVDPPPQDVAALLAAARRRLPGAEISLGCARPRGRHFLETLAIDAGVNRMALPSEEARQRAAYYGLAVEYRRTCCSVTDGCGESPW